MPNVRMFLLCIILSFVSIVNAVAVNPDEVLSNPALEARARSLSSEIRCLVCQNQSIDDSDATLARDLRVLVREKLVEGLEDQQILDHLVERYGEFVLLKPKFGSHTLLLWGIPFIGLLFGFFALFRLFTQNNKKQVSASPLTDGEQKALSKIFENK